LNDAVGDIAVALIQNPLINSTALARDLQYLEVQNRNDMCM